MTGYWIARQGTISIDCPVDDDQVSSSTVTDGNHAGDGTSDRLSKDAAVEALIQSLSQRQFDLVEVSTIRRRYCGDLGLTSGVYERLLQFHTDRFSSFDPKEVRTFTGHLFNYFDWNDAVLKRRLTNTIRR